MKIGLVRRGYSSSGGAEKYLKRFAQALAATGHQCVLFTGTEWPTTQWRFGEMVRVSSRASATPRAFADALAALRPREKCDWLFSLERVWDCDCYRAGDGVHRAWLERRARFEKPWRAWTRWLNGKHREMMRLEAQLFSREAKNRTVIANSRMVKNEIVRYFDFPAERIAVIYNGLPKNERHEMKPDLQAAMRSAVRRELKIADEDFVVLFVGSGWERKGLRFAIAAMDAAHRSGPTLLVAGEGKRRGLPDSNRVRFLGSVQNIPAILAASDLFLLPTIYDPFSNACLEALGAGLPVITTSSNGFSEIIQPGAEGEVLDDPADIDAIARAIERWSDPEKRARIKPRLQALAAEFSMKANLEATLALVKSRADF